VRLLITGGCGFIGSNFIRLMTREHPSWEIVNLDKLTYAGNMENLRGIGGNYRFIHGDIADRDLVEEISCEGIDAVVNFAAETHVDRSLLDPAPFIETNVKGTQVLLEAARVHEIRMLHISTDEVYGSTGKGRFTEDSPLLPNSPYAASKAAADLLCRAYHRSYGIPVTMTRSSNNYGPYQFPEKLIPLMITNALAGKDLPVYGDGMQVRDWLYVEDNCRAIALVLDRGKPGEVYNIGGECEKRNIDVVEAICRTLAEKLGRDPGDFTKRIRRIRDPRGAAHDFRYSLDCTKTKALGWSPSVPFDEGLARTVEWYLENQVWMKSVITGEYREYCEKVYGKG